MKYLFPVSLVFGWVLAAAIAFGGNVIIVGGSAATLPATGNLILDLNADVPGSINAGSPSDGDAVGTWVDQSATALSFTQSTSGQKPLYKVNIINGKPALLFASASDQKLTSSTGALFASGTANTSVLVGQVTSFPTAYRYGYNFKGAATASSPSFGLSTNAGYLDFFFGCDTTFAVNRWTTLSNNTSWHYIVVQYNGSTASTASNYNALDGTSAMTRTTISSNDGDTSNIIGSYKTSGTSHSWNGYITRWLVWNKKLDSTELTTLATYMTAQYAL